MTREIISFISPRVEAEFYARNGLVAHTRQLRRQSQGSPRWLALAALAGAVVALTFVHFFIR